MVVSSVAFVAILLVIVANHQSSAVEIERYTLLGQVTQRVFDIKPTFTKLPSSLSSSHFDLPQSRANPGASKSRP